MASDCLKYANAVDHLKHALAAPPRTGREDVTNGRRHDVMNFLETLKKKHDDQLAI